MSLFLLYDAPFPRHILKWHWKVTQGHMWPSLPRYGLHMVLITSGAQNELIFTLRCTVGEIQPILICVTLRWPWKVMQGQMWPSLPRYGLYASYTQGDQNQLISALRCTVSEIQLILICVILRWPWKVKQGHKWPSLPRYGLHMLLIPSGAKNELIFALRCTVCEIQPILIHLEMTLKGHTRLHVT